MSRVDGSVTSNISIVVASTTTIDGSDIGANYFNGSLDEVAVYQHGVVCGQGRGSLGEAVSEQITNSRRATVQCGPRRA
jgi:hypothetical protein